ncbi:DMT family transporter [Candidatus Woesearchaeota archaeon]|nr:DMT family transporter [Candidatus Woesearchaeota archaeon]
MNWILLSLIAMFFNFVVFILIRKLTKRMSSSVMSLYLFGISAIYLIITNLILEESYSMPKIAFLLLTTAGLAGSIVYLVLYKAISIAPNIGYPVAVFSLHIVITTIISALFLGTSLTLIKFIGVIIAAAGIISLILWK